MLQGTIFYFIKWFIIDSRHIKIAEYGKIIRANACLFVAVNAQNLSIFCRWSNISKNNIISIANVLTFAKFYVSLL